MKKFGLTILLLLVVLACHAQARTSGNYEFGSECMGVELDGSQTVKGWGFGRNRKDAVEQAKKNAVRDVLFKGIVSGKSECDSRPLLGEVNAQQKNETYFNKFFADGGEYLKYISLKDLGVGGIDRKKGRSGVAYGLTLRILRPQLKEKLIADGILKK
jgi:hypothetical protein